MYSLQRVLECAANSAKTNRTRCEVECVRIANDYAEPGYTLDNPDMPVVLANWNSETKWNSKTGEFDVLDNTMPRLCDILERMGCSIEWSDEWAECESCGKAFRTSQDSYGWRQSGVTNDGQCCCVECVDIPEYLESLEGNSCNCVTFDCNPAEHGYTRVDIEFENGLYGGQSADPKLIGDALRAQSIYRYLFTLDSTGQFDISFSVWIHDSQFPRLSMLRFQASQTDGVDPAKMMQNALQDATVKMSQLPDGLGVKYAKCKADGTADVRLVSPQEFSEGIED